MMADLVPTEDVIRAFRPAWSNATMWGKKTVVSGVGAASNFLGERQVLLFLPFGSPGFDGDVVLG
jgi:hypothetical protein